MRAAKLTPLFLLVLASCERPTLHDDVAITREDTPVTIDVLGNDADVSPEQLPSWILASEAGGTARVLSDGKLEYTPAPDFEGEDSFEYAVKADGEFLRAKVTVTVTPDLGPLERTELPLAEQPRAVVTADFDGDGLRDIVVYDEGNGLELFLQRAGTPRASFERRVIRPSIPPRSTGGSVHVQLLAFDVDADGHLDLVAGYGLFQVFLNRLHTSSTFEGHDLPLDEPVGRVDCIWRQRALGDFDADKKLDMVCAERDYAGFWNGLTYESGKLSFQKKTTGNNIGIERVLTVGDTDADGTDELLVMESGAVKTIRIVDGELQAIQNASVCASNRSFYRAVLFDADQTGARDIAVECESVELILATPGVDNVRLPYEGEPVTAADLDGDGKRELVVSDRQQLRFASFEEGLFHNRGDLDLSRGPGSSGRTIAVTAADLDRDGRDELMAVQRFYLTQGGFNETPKIEDWLTVLWSPR